MHDLGPSHAQFTVGFKVLCELRDRESNAAAEQTGGDDANNGERL